MSSSIPTVRVGRPPVRLRGFAVMGLLWSIFGVYQFATSTFSATDHLISMGLTPEQAAIYANSPLWMDAAFAVGVFGGVAGSALLLLLRRPAVPVLAASLVGYIVLYAGDAFTGVFAAFGTPQVVILTTVVIIAAGLFWLARHASKLHQLA